MHVKKTYNYIYDDLEELVEKLDSIDTLLNKYRTQGNNITWESSTVLTLNQKYAYTITIHADVDQRIG